MKNLLIIPLLFFTSGCGLLMAPVLIDKMGDLE